jgi:hypothetical protein
MSTIAAREHFAIGKEDSVSKAGRVKWINFRLHPKKNVNIIK